MSTSTTPVWYDRAHFWRWVETTGLARARPSSAMPVAVRPVPNRPPIKRPGTAAQTRHQPRTTEVHNLIEDFDHAANVVTDSPLYRSGRVTFGDERDDWIVDGCNSDEETDHSDYDVALGDDSYWYNSVRSGGGFPLTAWQEFEEEEGEVDGRTGEVLAKFDHTVEELQQLDAHVELQRAEREIRRLIRENGTLKGLVSELRAADEANLTLISQLEARQ